MKHMHFVLSRWPILRTPKVVYFAPLISKKIITRLSYFVFATSILLSHLSAQTDCECGTGGLDLSGSSISLHNLIQNDQLPSGSSDIGCISVPDNAVFTIDENYVFSGTRFYMGTNSTLVVAATYKLTLQNDCRLQACLDSWNGIQLQSSTAVGGKLDMSSSRIYNAKIGIDAQNLSWIRLVNNQFIDDYTGLKITGGVRFINFGDPNDFSGNTFSRDTGYCKNAIAFENANYFRIGVNLINPPVIKNAITGYVRGITIQNSANIYIFGMEITELSGTASSTPETAGRVGILSNSSANIFVKYCTIDGGLFHLFNVPFYGIASIDPRKKQVFHDNYIYSYAAGIHIEDVISTGVEIEIIRDTIIASQANIVVTNLPSDSSSSLRIEQDSLFASFQPFYGGGYGHEGNIELRNIHAPYKILNNYLTEPSQYKGSLHGINIGYSSGQGIISDNTISGTALASRIHFSIGASKNCKITGNSIQDVQNQSADDWGWGYSITNCTNMSFCCNSATGTDYGVLFGSANNDIEFKTTTFGVHDSALYFNPAASLTPQINTGNTWASATTNVDAFYNGGKQQARSNAFFRTNPSLIDSSKIIPVGWFFLLGSDPTCTGETYPCFETAPLDTFFVLTSTDEHALDTVEIGNEYVLRFEQQRQLYRKLKENPDLIDWSQAVTDFYHRADTTIVGAMDAVDEAFRRQFNLSPDLQASIDDYLYGLDSLSMLVDTIYAQYPNASEAEQEAMESDFQTISGLALEYLNAMDTLSVQADNQVKTHLTQLLTDNANLPVVNDWESNERDINVLFFKYFGRAIDTFTAAEKSQIEALAYSCPQYEGAGVYKARILHGLFIDSTFTGYFENQCVPGEERVAGLSTPDEIDASITVVPNPASTSIRIQQNQPTIARGLIVIRDVAGKELVSMTMDDPEIELELSYLKPGIYILSWYPEKSKPFNKKIIILH